MFACTVCGAATAETISDGAAAIEVVRHAPSCALLALRTRERWPLAAPALPNHTRPHRGPTSPPIATRCGCGRSAGHGSRGASAALRAGRSALRDNETVHVLVTRGGELAAPLGPLCDDPDCDCAHELAALDSA